MEIWKPVKGYEGLYEVSNEGRVRSLCRNIEVTRRGKKFTYHSKGKMISPLKRCHGYLGVMLYGKGGNKRGFKMFAVHRLVADAFIPNPNGLREVNHIDEDKTNNRSDNLEWISRKGNVNYGTIKQRRREKNINGSCSTPIQQFTKDGVLVKTYPSLAEVERQTGWAKANICRCAQGSNRYSHAYGYIWRYASDIGGRKIAIQKS